MAKSEQASFLEPSESKQRCNSFIRDLFLHVNLEYPTLGIHAINPADFFTEHNNPETFKNLLKHFDSSGDISSLQLVGAAVHQMSSSVSLALVSIIPEKGIEHPVSFIKLAISDVDQSALSFGGDRAETNKVLNIAKAPFNPDIFIVYEFFSESFKKEHKID